MGVLHADVDELVEAPGAEQLRNRGGTEEV